jgi:exopolysaccharide biosynthesis protein
MVVVDTGGDVKGVTTPQLAKILQALGTVNAMNFDGGGSSTMFVKDQGINGLVNLPYGSSTQRKVRSVIYVR